MKKYSRQREALLTEIRNRKDHPTAEDLYQSLRTIMPNYSLGTVYRNLTELCATGYVMKIASVSGPERYDGMCNATWTFYLYELWKSLRPRRRI